MNGVELQQQEVLTGIRIWAVIKAVIHGAFALPHDSLRTAGRKVGS